MISLWSFLTLQPWRTNSTASQSSSPGWDGGFPCLPKLSWVSTMPRPKWCCQTWFTNTRAVRGWSGRVSQRAKARRWPLVSPFVSGGRTASVPPGRLTTSRKPGRDRRPGTLDLAALQEPDLGWRRQVPQGLDLVPGAPIAVQDPDPSVNFSWVARCSSFRALTTSSGATFSCSSNLEARNFCTSSRSASGVARASFVSGRIFSGSSSSRASSRFSW